MKKKFCCEATRHMYEDYYKRQSGGAMPVFVGRRYQRGHGLGSVLGSLFRKVVPFIKSNIGNVGRRLLSTGVNVAGDVLGGKKIKDSVKDHLPRGLKRTVEHLDWSTAHPKVRRVGSALTKTGANIVGDVIGGRRFKEAAGEGIKRAFQDLSSQTGSGRRRRQIVKRRKLPTRRHKDIFE